MKVQKKYTIFTIAMLLLVGVFASQAAAQVAILNNLADKGIEITALNSDQLAQEKAKGGYYYLSGANGGTWKFTVGGRQVDSKPEWIVSGIVSTRPSSGNFDFYYQNSTGSQLWLYNSATRTLASSVSGPIVYWASYGYGGFGYVRGGGSYSKEIKNLPRIGSGTRSYAL